MTEKMFCHCCRVHHDKSQMRQVQTRLGPRWRCLRSIQEAARPGADRDAFGRAQTAINRESARLAAELVGRLRRIEFSG